MNLSRSFVKIYSKKYVFSETIFFLGLIVDPQTSCIPSFGCSVPLNSVVTCNIVHLKGHELKLLPKNALSTIKKTLNSDGLQLNWKIFFIWNLSQTVSKQPLSRRKNWRLQLQNGHKNCAFHYHFQKKILRGSFWLIKPSLKGFCKKMKRTVFMTIFVNLQKRLESAVLGGHCKFSMKSIKRQKYSHKNQFF